MQVAFVGLLPHPIRFWLSSSLIKSHVFTDDNGIPPQSVVQVLQLHDVQQRNAGEQNDEKP
ncbi:hypothetical protein ACNF0Q_07525 [Escherichia coli]